MDKNSTLFDLKPKEETIAYLKMLARQMQTAGTSTIAIG